MYSSSGPQRLVYIGTAALIAIILAANAALTLHLRDSELDVQKRQLASLSLVLAEQADREFQSIDLVLASVVDYMANHGVVDEASLARRMAGRDIQTLLKEKISGIPQLDAVTVIDADGRLVNFSRYWPIPSVRVTDRDYFQTLKADPNRRTFISAPVQNRGTGTWTIYLARRVTGADGRFLGLVLGAIQLSYFEEFYRAVAPSSDSRVILLRRDGMRLVRYPSAGGVGGYFGADRILGSSASTVAILPALVRRRTSAQGCAFGSTLSVVRARHGDGRCGSQPLADDRQAAGGRRPGVRGLRRGSRDGARPALAHASGSRQGAKRHG